jgi:hypothetical protein
MFINSELRALGFLRVDLFQCFIPLQHDRQDVTGILGVFLVLLRKAPEKIFGSFLADRLLVFHDGRGLVDASPEGKRLESITQFAPGRLRKVPALKGAIILQVFEQGGKKLIAVLEDLPRVRAERRPFANFPTVVHRHDQWFGTA